MTPFDYQEQSITHLLDILPRERGVVDASDMGTGKTLVGVEVQKRLNLPTLVICPKVVIPGWLRTAAMQDTDLDVINYEMVRSGRTPYGSWEKISGCRKPRFVWNSAIGMLEFDEGHRCQGYTSANAELMRAARRQNIPTLVMSATLADSPLQLDALGCLLRLHDSNFPPTLRTPDPVSFWRWASRHRCGKGFFSALEFHGTKEEKQAEMAKLNALIFPAKGVRVTIDELGDKFPDCQVTAELFEMGDPARMEKLYQQMEASLRQLWERHGKLEGERLRRAQEDFGFEGDQLPEDPLIMLLRARQQVELLKVPGIVDAAEDAIQSGLSVAIFVNFRQTLQAICAELQTDCFIDGSQTGTIGALQREANRLDFVEDRSRVIVIVSEAGGVGLDLPDLRGVYPRLSLVCPGYNAKTLRQICGRTRRANSKSKSLVRILFAEGTCEMPVHKRVSQKLDRLDALQDGDLMPGNLVIDR